MKWKDLLKVPAGSWLLIEPADGAKRRYVILVDTPTATIRAHQKEPYLLLDCLEWEDEEAMWGQNSVEPHEVLKVIGTIKPIPLRKQDKPKRKRKKDQE